MNCNALNIKPSEVGCNTLLIEGFINKTFVKTQDNYDVLITKRDIIKYSEETRQRLIRRARDVFNKNRDVQLDIVAHMICGGLIRTDNLD